MAFAAKPNRRSLNKVSEGTLAELQKNGVKEDGSVSNSSSTTNGRESVYEESEANKAPDGSSSNDSGSTVKAYKESTQDESCSSGSRSEQAQDTEPKQMNSLKTAGPVESVGSVGHPDKCKPCAFYCFSICGCRMERECQYCHLFHQSRLKQRREEWKKSQRTRRNKPKSKSEAREEAQILTPGALGQHQADGYAFAHMAPAQAPMSAMPPFPAPGLTQAPMLPPDLSRAGGFPEHAEWEGEHGESLHGLIQQVARNTVLLQRLLPVLSRVVPGCADQDGMHMPAPYFSNGPAATNTVPSAPSTSLQEQLSALAAQGIVRWFEYVPNNLELFVGQMLELWPPVAQMRGCVFAVAPRLPMGVSLDEHTGLLHGRPQERTAGQVTYFITACNPHRKPTVVNIALVKLTINSAFDPYDSWMR